MVPVNRLSTPCANPEATLDQPIEHLRACHRRIEERLAALERAVASLASHPEEARGVITRSLRFLETNGVWHTEDEERSIFPRLVPKLGEGADREFLAELEIQHAHVEPLVTKLREMSPADPAFAELATQVAQAYRDHIRFEEARLVDLAAGSLTSAEIEAIASEMKSRRGL